jgi:trk system potassium uptake protein TrkH
VRWRPLFNIVGLLVFFLGLGMVLPLAVALYYRDGSSAAILNAMVATTATGLGIHICVRGHRMESISQREGMAIVTIGWTLVGIFGALPFFFGQGGYRFTDALFESVSGFTTTGASIFTDVEVLPRGLLFWRSFIQWLGGMGIIVLSVAILPFLGVGGMQLYKAEVPSPVPDKLRPRIRDTARIMWKVYALFTAVQVLFLLMAGMGLFEAVCHTFTTMPTGGFSTRNASVAAYGSPYMDFIFIFFMVLAGMNFSLDYQFMRGQTLVFWRDPECRFYLGIVALLSLAVSWNLWGDVYAQFAQALRYGTFQVASLITTTGYVTADYEQWPAMSQLILLLCMFIGASAGSTGGAIKCLRLMLCIKYCYRELFTLVHPHAVTHIKIAGKTVPEEVIRSVMGFLALYMGIFVLASVLLSAFGTDFVTSFSAVATTLGNVGPGFGTVGPVENFAHLPGMGKWILIWCMLVGRLEIFTVIILLVPEFWRK